MKEVEGVLHLKHPKDMALAHHHLWPVKISVSKVLIPKYPTYHS
jgi:hypothetical protein